MKLLEVDSVSKRFGGVVAVDGVSFHVDREEVVGVIGPNGAGKTTLFDCISGLQRPTGGRIRVDATDVTGRPAHRIATLGLARTFQIPRLFSQLSVVQNVMVGAFAHEATAHGARRRALDCLEQIGLGRDPELPAGRLNLADRRRLEIARVLALQPRIVLLDEAMSGLSDAETDRMMELVRELNRGGATFVLVEHVMKVVMGLCVRLVVLDHGQVLTVGSPREVVSDERVIHAYLGEPLESEVNGGTS